MSRIRTLTTGVMGLALGALGAAAPPALGATAVTDPGNMALRNNGVGNWSGNTGFEFTVGKQDLAVSSLGIYDAPGNAERADKGEVGDGLETEAVVTVYETTGKNAVAQAVVPAGGDGELKDSYRFVKLKEPLTLHANATYRIVIGVSRGGNGFLDYKGGDKTPQCSADLTVGIPVFTEDGNAVEAAYPGGDRGGRYKGVAFSGPNFQYQATGQATAPPKVQPMTLLRSSEAGPDNQPQPSSFPGTIVTSANFDSPQQAVPEGWRVGPGTPAETTLAIADFGVGGASSLKVTNDWPMYRQSEEGSLSYTFQKPVDRVAIEFDVKWTNRPHAAFRLFTKGPDSSGPSQVNLTAGRRTLNQSSGIVNGHSWIFAGGEKENDSADASHWYRVRVVVDKDSNGIDVWVSEPDQTKLPEKPTRTLPAYGPRQSIASVNFGVVGIWANNYYLDNVTLRTGNDIPAPSALPDTLAESMAKGYQLWTGKTFPRTFEEIPFVEGLKFHIVATASEQGRWQHGASIAFHEGALYASWGANPRGENSPGEVVLGAKSTDDGQTWSEPFMIAPGGTVDGEAYSNSHGVFKNHQGKLWGFFQHWKGGWDNPLAIEAFVLDDQTGKFESKGIVGREGWPIDPAQPLDNGNWVIGLSGFNMWYPAILISHGDDLTKWDTVKIPTKDRRRFPETSLITYGNNVLSLTRWGQWMLVAESSDGGRTWPQEAQESNFPNVANVTSGVLSTGQWFIVANMRSREDLEIAVGKPGEKGVSKLYRIRYGSPPEAPYAYEGKTFPRSYGYPSALEHDGKLYVIYSVNKNDIELAIIPIASLKADGE